MTKYKGMCLLVFKEERVLATYCKVDLTAAHDVIEEGVNSVNLCYKKRKFIFGIKIKVRVVDHIP